MQHTLRSTTRHSGGHVLKGIREGVFAGLISLGLFVLYIGLGTQQNMSNQLILVQR